MSIPLVQKPEKDDINTSIIAIKRNIERINMLLGLVDSGSDPDLSGLATKQELQDAVTELTPVDEVTSGNMHSVSSNAVAEAFSNALDYTREEVDTGEYYYGTNTKYKVYKRNIYFDISVYTDSDARREFVNEITLSSDVTTLISADGYFRFVEPTTSNVYGRYYAFGSTQMQPNNLCILCSTAYYNSVNNKLYFRIQVNSSNFNVTKLSGSIQIKYTKSEI